MRALRASFAALFLLATFYASQATAQSQGTGPVVTSQIHNAPGWEPTTSYTYTVGPPTNHKTRVVNGAGWNGTSFTYGSALKAYELIAPTSGSCTSAGSGGPSGTGSSITDGGCTWKYLSGVDYVSITGWQNDNGIVWGSGTTYYYSDVVRLNTSPYSVFGMGFSGGSAGPTSNGCVSTIAPTIGASGTMLADGCEWWYYGDLTYSSGNGTMPSQNFPWHWTITACTGANSSCNTTGHEMFVTAITGGPMTNTDATEYLWAGGSPTIQAIGGGAGPRLCPKDDVTSATIATGGTGYAVNDTVTLGGGSNGVFVSPAVLTVTSVSGGVITGVSITGTGPYTQTVSNPLAPSATSGSGTGATFNLGYTFTANWGTGEYVMCDNFANPVTASAISPQTMIVTQDDVTQWYMTGSEYDGLLWNDQEYVDGSNGEVTPLISFNHQSRHNDSLNIAAASFQSLTKISAAPGEGFGDTLAANPSQAIPTTYNSNLGVSINGGTNPAMCNEENIWTWQGLQLNSTVGPSVDGLGLSCGTGQVRSCNVCTFKNDLTYSGINSTAACECGATDLYQDNVMITTGYAGQTFDYPGYFLNNTVVNVGSRTNTVAIQSVWNFRLTCGMQIFGNAVYGFGGFYSYNGFGGTLGVLASQCSPDPSFPNSSDDNNVSMWTGGNITDNASTDAVSGYWLGGSPAQGGTQVTTGVPSIAGVTYSSPITSAFSNTSNLRSIGPSSTLYGARSSLATLMAVSSGQQGIGGVSGLNTCAVFGGNSYWDGGQNVGNATPCMIDADNADVIGTTRPQGQGFDVGAVEFSGGTVPPGNIFPFVHGMFGSADTPLKYAETAK